MRFQRLLWILPLLLAGLGGCATRGPAWEQMDAEVLFEYGMEELRTRRWTEAAAAFERFLLVHPNSPRVQEARFRLGETYQGRREWVTAAMEFNRLAAEFPAGAWADDARFEVCRSYHELAPPVQLDQEYTRTAIAHCESLLAFYPDSQFVPRAQEIITELTHRLAEKDFRTAEEYARRRALDSAIIYYESVAREYPGTTWAPRALLRLVETYDRLGYEPESRAARDRLLRQFPDSPEARQISGIAAVNVP
jgi:outer membrane protein assembly factor BamD